MANTTDWVRGRVTLPHLFKDAASALLDAARLRPVHQVRPISFFNETAEVHRQVNPAWAVAYRHLEKAAARARRAANRPLALGTSAWTGKASGDLALSRRAMAAFAMIEIRVHVGIRTFAAARGLVADTCDWLDAAAEADGGDLAVCQRQLRSVADRLDAYARKLRTVLRIA